MQTTTTEATAEKTLVFVYGTLRRGCGNHDLLTGARFVATGRTVEQLTMVDLGAFPAVVPFCGSTPIVGEIYEVDAATLERLDRLEGYPHHYDRRRFAVEPDDADKARCTPWVYVYRRLPLGSYDVVAGGDWTAR